MANECYSGADSQRVRRGVLADLIVFLVLATCVASRADHDELVMRGLWRGGGVGRAVVRDYREEGVSWAGGGG